MNSCSAASAAARIAKVLVVLTWMSLLIGCAGRPGHYQRDVIPERWITATGLGGSWDHVETRRRPDAYVFPSRNERAVQEEEISCEMQVIGTGHFPSQRSVNLLKDSARFGRKARIEFNVTKLDDTKLNVHLPADSIERIRRLNWSRFCRLQRVIVSKLKSYGVEHDASELRSVWLRILDSARPMIVARTAPRNGQLGLIPLEPGMRLVVQWGGTATYQPRAPRPLVRQAVGGRSVIPIIRRNGSVALGISPFYDDENGGEWSFRSKRPMPFAFPGTDPVHPFGNIHRPQYPVSPVFNEFDLRRISALRPAGADGSDADHLSLIVPSEYISADFADDGDGGSAEIAYAQTSDAHHAAADADPSRPDHPIDAVLRRRYMIWRSSEPLSVPPDLTSSWATAPLVFANQSTLSVEVLARIGDDDEHWVMLGTTWADLLESRGMWFGASAEGRRSVPAFRVIRRGYAREPVVYRFWSDHFEDLRSFEIQHGDTLVVSGRLR